MYDNLKLENQLCFPLYVCSKEIIRKYKPTLEKLDLTYTQYIVMLILWEYGEMNVSAIGEKMYLDSGTLTPLLRKLEEKKYIICKRLDDDKRNVVVELSEQGLALRDKAVQVPDYIAKCVNLTEQEALTLYRLLYKVLIGIENKEIK